MKSTENQYACQGEISEINKMRTDADENLIMVIRLICALVNVWPDKVNGITCDKSYKLFVTKKEIERS